MQQIRDGNGGNDQNDHYHQQDLHQRESSLLPLVFDISCCSYRGHSTNVTSEWPLGYPRKPAFLIIKSSNVRTKVSGNPKCFRFKQSWGIISSQSDISRPIPLLTAKIKGPDLTAAAVQQTTLKTHGSPQSPAL